MKNNKNALRMGTLLLAAGCILFLGSLFGMLYTQNMTVQTDETRQAAIAQCERDIANAYRMIASRSDELRSYYNGRLALDGISEAQSAKYSERLSLLARIEAEIADSQPLSSDAYNSIRHLVSIDGIENEVTTLNNLQNQLGNLYKRQSELTEYTAALGTGTSGVNLPRALFYALIVLGTALLICGLMLNHSYRTKHVISQFLLYLLLIVGAVIMVFPFYWMISSSFKTRVEISRFPPEFIPGNFLNIDNYRIAFKQAPFATYFLNSVIVCICSVAVVTFTTILAAFAFSRLKFPGREFIFSALLSMMMLPFEMLVITNYSTIIHLNLNDSLAALVFPFISSIFYTYIMRNFFASIPDSLYWSARVDGCSNWHYLWKIMVPIGRPSLVTVVLLNALASWNSFMWPLLVIKSTPKRTLPFGLYAFTTEAGSYQELIMAASTVVVLPMIILFLFARKQILRGVARGGLKG